jgi:glucose/mannose transport system permease protein
VRKWGPGVLLVTPSIVAVAVFVYGLIGWNFKIAMSDEHTFYYIYHYHFVGLQNFIHLWSDGLWRRAVIHELFFTVIFVGGALLLGLVLALLLDKKIRAEAIFRTVYLLPLAVSFIAAGIVWKWLMNPAAPPNRAGLNVLFQHAGLGFLANSWFASARWGVAAVALPALWQMSGYVMALYIAGLRGVPDELREAARVDGASEYQIYRRIILPQLRPVTLAALIILGHISLKIFDVFVSVAGISATNDIVPAVYIWQKQFSFTDSADAATAASYLLLAVAMLVVPYLIWSVRLERRS